MQGILENLKRFLSNKNTVTILGVIGGVLVLYIGYNWRVKEAIKPLSVPYAKEELSSRTQITDDVIGYMEISSGLTKVGTRELITSSALVLNQFVSYGVTIPENSFFYKSAVMSKNEMPSTTFTDDEVKNGYTVYSLNVDLHKTYGNSICPGNYIDLYLKAKDGDKVIFGKFIESIKVLDVRDSEGNRVFETTAEARRPAELLFAVPDDLYLLLMKTQYVSGGIEVIPVPRNASYSDKKDDKSTKVASDYIRNFILSQTATISDQEVLDSDTYAGLSTSINSSTSTTNNN